MQKAELSRCNKWSGKPPPIRGVWGLSPTKPLIFHARDFPRNCKRINYGESKWVSVKQAYPVVPFFDHRGWSKSLTQGKAIPSGRRSGHVAAPGRGIGGGRIFEWAAAGHASQRTRQGIANARKRVGGYADTPCAMRGPLMQPNPVSKRPSRYTSNAHPVTLQRPQPPSPPPAPQPSPASCRLGGRRCARWPFAAHVARLRPALDCQPGRRLRQSCRRLRGVGE